MQVSMTQSGILETRRKNTTHLTNKFATLKLSIKFTVWIDSGLNKCFAMALLRRDDMTCHPASPWVTRAVERPPIWKPEKLWVCLEWEVWIKDLKNQPNQPLHTLLALPVSRPQSPEAFSPGPEWKRSEMCNGEMVHKRILLKNQTNNA